MRVGNDKIIFSPSQSARNDQAENFPNCPKKFKHEDISRVPKIIGQNKKISKCPKFFSIRTFLECPIFLGRNEKFNVYDFPTHAKISKVAQFFSKHHGIKVWRIFLSTRFVEFPKLSAEMRNFQPL